MNNLKRLMEEFSILGMEPAPLEAESGLEFHPDDTSTEEEYELDAEGNPVLDANGMPVKKVKPSVPGAPVAGACTCDDNATDPMAGATPPLDRAIPSPQGIVPQLPPEDEFDFEV